MQPEGENIQATRSTDGEDLAPEFTLEEYWAEIDAEIRPFPPIQEGDITTKMILIHYGKTIIKGNYSYAYEVMDRMVKTGGWEKVKVYNPDTRKPATVLRKIK